MNDLGQAWDATGRGGRANAGIAGRERRATLDRMAKKSRGTVENDGRAVTREFARLQARMKRSDPAPVDRRARGLKKLTEIVGVEGGRVLTGLVEFSPEVTRDIVDHAYGAVLAEVKLEPRTRALIVVAALAAMGNTEPELRVHVGSALNSGCTREEILDALRVVSLYAGFPAALNGLSAARTVFAERDRRAGRKTGRGRRKQPA